MTTSKSPAAPPRCSSCCTVRSSVERTLAASPVAMPVDLALRVEDARPAPGRSPPARLTRSSWSRIWLNSTRLTMTTTVPATSMVIAPMRTCSDDRQACTARRASRRPTGAAATPAARRGGAARGGLRRQRARPRRRAGRREPAPAAAARPASRVAAAIVSALRRSRACPLTADRPCSRPRARSGRPRASPGPSRSWRAAAARGR